MENRFRAALKGTSSELKVLNENSMSLESAQSYDAHENGVGNSSIEVSVKNAGNFKSRSNNIVNNTQEFSVEDSTLEERLNLFIKEKVGSNIFELRINKIKDIINSLIQYECDEKKIKIIDHEDNINLWIETIKKSLPASVSNNLTFKVKCISEKNNIGECTIFYNLNNESNNNIAGEGSFIEYNFLSRNNTDIVKESDYAKLVQVGLLLNDSILPEFKSFIDQFNYFKLDSGIDDCLALFKLLNSNMEEINLKDIMAAFDFVDKHADINSCKMMSVRFEGVLRSCNMHIDEKTAIEIVKLALAIGNRNEEGCLYPHIYNFIIQYIQHIFSVPDPSSACVASAFYKQIKNLDSKAQYSLEDHIINEESILQLCNSFDKNNSEYIKFYLGIFINQIKKRSYQWKEFYVYERFINMYIDHCIHDLKQLEELIDQVQDNNLLTAVIFSLYNDKYENKNVGKEEFLNTVIKKVSTYDSKKAKELRGLLFQNSKGRKLLIDEFKTKLQKSNNKSQFFWEYNNEVFNNIKGFREECFSTVIEDYINSIKGEPIYKIECPVIFNMIDKNQIYVEKEALTRIIEDYESEIPFGKPDQVTQLIMMTLSKIKKEKRIETINNVTMLSEIGISLQNSNSQDDIKRVINNIPQLGSIAKKRYVYFINWCMDIISCNSSSDIMDMIEYYRKVRIAEESSKDIFIDSIIEGSLVKGNLKKLQAEIIIVYYYLKERNLSWHDSGKYGEFILESMEQLTKELVDIKYILEKLIDDYDYLVNILIRLYEKPLSNNAAILYYVENNKKNGQVWSDAIRVLLSKNISGCKLMFEEFKLELMRHQDKNQFFWEYYNNEFKDNKEYRNCCFSDAAKYFLNFETNTGAQGKKCENIINIMDRDELNIQKDVVIKVVTGFEKALSLSNPKEQQRRIISQVEKIKQMYNISTNPDISSMIMFTMELNNISEPESTLACLNKVKESARLNIDSLDEERYIEYINWNLSVLAAKINIVDNLETIISLFTLKDSNRNFNALFALKLLEQIKVQDINLSMQQVKTMIDLTGRDVQAACSIVAEYYSQASLKGASKDAVKVFMDFTDNLEEKNMLETFIQLSTVLNCCELLFEEYQERLNNADNKTLYFWSYLEKVLSKATRYKEIYCSRIIERYICSIRNNKEYGDECLKIIKSIKADKTILSLEVLARIVSGYEDTLRLAAPRDEQQANIDELLKLKLERGVETTPAIAEAIRFGTKLQGFNDSSSIKTLIENTKLGIKNIDMIRYEDLLDWCLPKLIASVEDYYTHVKIKALLCDEKKEGFFFTKYVGLLGNILESYRVEGIKIFSRFIIALFLENENLEEEVFAQVRANIINVLSRQQDTVIKEVGILVCSEAYTISQGETIVAEWENIIRRIIPISRQDKGFLGKLFKK